MPRKSSTPATSQLPDNVPQDVAAADRDKQAKLAIIRAEAQTALANLHMPVEYHYESFVELIRSAAVQMGRASLVLGSALLAIKANESRGRWLSVLEQIGLPERSAYAAMTLAQKVGQSDAHTKLYDELGSSKVMQLFRQLTDDDIQQLADDDEAIEAIAGKTAREVYQEFQDYRANQQADMDAKDAILARKDAQLNKQQQALERQAAELDPDQRRMQELMRAYSEASGEALASLAAMEEFRDQMFALRPAVTDATWSSACQAMSGGVMLLENVMARLADED